MKTSKLLLCFLSFILASATSSYAQAWKWGREGYGSIKTNDYASPVSTDKDGNAYITGQYTTTITFGNYTLTTPGENAFLTKYNSSGNVLWAESLEDSIGSFGTAIATDKAENTYITGYFYGNAQAGSFLLSSHATSAFFIVKYNANGTVLWAKQSTALSSFSPAQAFSITTDNNDNAIVAGSYQDTAIFGTDTLRTPNNYSGIFLVKYDSAGNLLWAKTASGSYNYASQLAVTTDKQGNFYLIGYFQDSAQFGATKLFAPNNSVAGFIVKYSPTGNVLWAKQTTNGSSGSYCAPLAITTDRSGYPYITGYFKDIIKFGTHTLYSPAAYSVFLAKYDMSGNCIWAKQSSPGWTGTGLSFDQNNYIYMAGIAGNPDSLRFDYYAIAPNPWASNASFIMMFDTVGHPICGSIINNLGTSYSNPLNGIASDPTGNYIYTAGTFNDTVLCGWDVLTDQGGGYNTFVGRWINCNSAELGTTEMPAQNADVVLYPNPSTGIFTMLSSVVSGQSVEVYNVLGEKVYSNYQIAKLSNYQIDLTAQPNGIYLYRVTDNNGSLIGNGKLVIEK